MTNKSAYKPGDVSAMTAAAIGTTTPATLSPFDRAIAEQRCEAGRLERARRLCLHPDLHFDDDGMLLVPSLSSPGKYYSFMLDTGGVNICICTDSKRGANCMHKTCAKIVKRTGELDTPTLPGSLPASLMAAREAEQARLKRELYPVQENTRWCKWCNAHQTVRQEERSECCTYACDACQNVIDESAQESPKVESENAKELREWREQTKHLSTSEVIHRAGADQALEEEQGI